MSFAAEPAGAGGVPRPAATVEELRAALTRDAVWKPVVKESRATVRRSEPRAVGSWAAASVAPPMVSRAEVRASAGRPGGAVAATSSR